MVSDPVIVGEVVRQKDSCAVSLIWGGRRNVEQQREIGDNCQIGSARNRGRSDPLAIVVAADEPNGDRQSCELVEDIGELGFGRIHLEVDQVAEVNDVRHFLGLDQTGQRRNEKRLRGSDRPRRPAHVSVGNENDSHRGVSCDGNAKHGHCPVDDLALENCAVGVARVHHRPLKM
jgi:hypothetical protein